MSFIIFGSGYSVLRTHKVTPAFIDFYNSKDVTIIVQVTAQPDIRDTHQKITLSVTSVDDRLVTGKVLLLVESGSKIFYGDSVEVFCQLEQPQPIEGFAYDKYLERFSIYSLCAFPKSIRTTRNIETNIVTWLFSFRGYLENNINTTITEPAASLLKGVLLGDKKGLGEELTEVFRRTGLSHIVALSGYNISILVAIALAIGPYLYLSRRILFF